MIEKGKLRDDAGVTLIEILVVVALISILGTMSMGAMRNYGKGQDHRGAIREVVAKLRNAQVRAVTEATTYQCRFDTTSVPHTLKVYRDSANPPDESNRVGSTYTLSDNLQFVDVSFTHSDASPAFACFFYARGSADPGSLSIRRVDNARKFDLAVEQLTARVSYDS